jgi:hypothetical protein
MAREGVAVSEQRNDGGPAFPHPAGWRRDPEISDGMTLRDYFAAHASDDEITEMLGRLPLVDKVVLDGSSRRIVPGRPDNARQIARYMHADAMLKARQA